jgi:hypothetical protein
MGNLLFHTQMGDLIVKEANYQYEHLCLARDRHESA